MVDPLRTSKRRQPARRGGQPGATGAGDPAAATATRLVRLSTWAGLVEGDAVDVGGEARRGAAYTFVAHVRNARTGEEWVEVVGGRGGRRTVRSFAPDRIYPPGGLASRRRAPSLACAPQLPLGRGPG